MHWTFGGTMHRKNIYTIIVVVVAVILGISYLVSFEKEEENDVLIVEETVTFEQSESEYIYVHICGYVASPGVYQVEEGTRLYNVIELAGGVTAEGCVETLELARFVKDEETIYVPSVDEAVSMKMSGGSLVNINKADKELLMTLPGIGESKAETIISFRNENGDFSCIEDIMNIPGIKEAAFSKIKDYICVN